jgi:tRNA threonylcarbamoyladenosine modification (KEOPS) complex  Pcc1 subunit
MTLGAWSASILVQRPSEDSARRLHRALAPEAEREVPRARCTLRQKAGGRVELGLSTQDTGALRAALNTYLGWIALADATEHLSVGATPAVVPAPEALK